MPVNPLPQCRYKLRSDFPPEMVPVHYLCIYPPLHLRNHVFRIINLGDFELKRGLPDSIIQCSYDLVGLKDSVEGFCMFRCLKEPLHVSDHRFLLRGEGDYFNLERGP